MKRRHHFLFLLFFFGHHQFAICQASSASRMEFMIGKWDLFSNGSVMGKSTIDTILEKHVIEEDFVEFPPEPFLGRSWTTYDSVMNKWHMTTVDNQGNHSVFFGSWRDGKLVFERFFKNKKGEDRIQKLTYYNITANSFDWTFNASFDAGLSWKTYYTVHYVRKLK